VKTVTQVQGHQPIVYPVALVAAGRKKELAQELIDFLSAPESVEILKKYGFGSP
jgi:ABC-type molybdate transport system substrate-binding protein